MRNRKMYKSGTKLKVYRIYSPRFAMLVSHGSSCYIEKKAQGAGDGWLASPVRSNDTTCGYVIPN